MIAELVEAEQEDIEQNTVLFHCSASLICDFGY